MSGGDLPPAGLMAFFRTINFADPLPSVVGEGVILRTPQATDHAEWAALREHSREFTPWGADLAGGSGRLKGMPGRSWSGAGRQTPFCPAWP